MRSCSCANWRRVSSFWPADFSSTATCRSTRSNSCCAFWVDFMAQLRRSTDYTHAAPSAELLYSCNEITIRQHIIAFRFHHHHQISGTFHVEQYPGFAFSLAEKRVQIVHRGLARGFERHANPNCAGQWDLGFVQRHNL